MCSAEVCYAEQDGTVNYFDDNHLSATKSRELEKYFLPTIRALI